MQWELKHMLGGSLRCRFEYCDFSGTAEAAIFVHAASGNSDIPLFSLFYGLILKHLANKTMFRNPLPSKPSPTFVKSKTSHSRTAKNIKDLEDWRTAQPLANVPESSPSHSVLRGERYGCLWQEICRGFRQEGQGLQWCWRPCLVYNFSTSTSTFYHVLRMTLGYPKRPQPSWVSEHLTADHKDRPQCVWGFQKGLFPSERAHHNVSSQMRQIWVDEVENTVLHARETFLSNNENGWRGLGLWGIVY